MNNVNKKNDTQLLFGLDELSAKKYPVSALGTKPTLLKSTIDKTSLHPLLKDMYLHARKMVKNMSKADRDTVGRDLLAAVRNAYTNFGMSYYHINTDEGKLSPAYNLLCSLEEIKFLTDVCFTTDILATMYYKQREGLRNNVYITVAAIQEQADK